MTIIPNSTLNSTRNALYLNKMYGKESTVYHDISSNYPDKMTEEEKGYHYSKVLDEEMAACMDECAKQFNSHDLLSLIRENSRIVKRIELIESARSLTDNEAVLLEMVKKDVAILKYYHNMPNIDPQSRYKHVLDVVIKINKLLEGKFMGKHTKETAVELCILTEQLFTLRKNDMIKFKINKGETVNDIQLYPNYYTIE